MSVHPRGFDRRFCLSSNGAFYGGFWKRRWDGNFCFIHRVLILRIQTRVGFKFRVMIILVSAARSVRR